MCRTLRRLTREQVSGLVLPFVIVEASCTLRVGGNGAHSYAGTLLKQRRADHFFDYFTGLELFSWSDLVERQHDLWRHGIGLADADEVLGPRNWALVNGRLYLADTGSITEDLREVRRVVSAVELDAREKQIPEWWPDHRDERLPEYFEYVRTRVNDEQLARLWRAAYTAVG